MRWPLLPLILLAGCPWIGGSELDERLDADGDGYLSVAVGGVDCNDDDPNVHPDAIERCDGIDDDCDGAIDDGTDDAIEGGQPFTLDGDGDGHGQVGGAVVQACETPEGFAPTAGDCDDGNPAVHPGADERCNGVDDDCDDRTDEDPIDGQVRYADADGDSYGDPDSAEAVCANGGTVGNGLDCDDTDPTRNPDTSWYADDDGDGYGDPDRFVQSSCVGPMDAAANDRDCDDTDDTLHPDTEWHEDADGDDFGGVVVATQCDGPVGTLQRGGDCDDTNARVNPDTEWFEDADGDGYPGSVLSPASCVAPKGGVLVPTDCNDADDTISPDGIEVCSPGNVDEDCDGFVDDLDTDTPPADADPWFFDNDGDGWGTGAPDYFCAPPNPFEYSELSGDCNDLRPTQHPDTVWILDDDGDGYWPTTGLTTQQCDKPSDDHRELELVIDDPFDIDCDDTSDTVYPGADEFCDEIDSDCDDDTNDPDSTGERTWFRDDDGDGFGDVRFDTLACFQPGGYAIDADDCDDDDDQAYPGAYDPCYDGADLDCDGDDEDDCDGDGFLRFSDGGEDCDDLDPLVSPDLPTTRTVPGDHPTVQAALDAACAYDMVLVDAGTYVEQLVAPRPVHLVGAGAGATRLDGGGTDRPVTWAGGTLQDLTVQNGVDVSGGCIYENGDDPIVLRDVVLDGCFATGSGGGLQLTNVDYTLERVDLVDCGTNGTGGGLSISAGDGSLTDVTCTDCYGASGGALSIVFADIDIDGLRLVRPTGLASVFLATSFGGTWTDITLEQPESITAGLLLVGAGDVAPAVIDGLLVDRPATSNGGNAGVWAQSTSDLTLTDVVVRNGDIDAPLFPAHALDIGVVAGQAVLSGIRVEDTAARIKLTTSVPAGRITLEHGTFVETEGGLLLDANVPEGITVRNTVVAYDRGSALTIDGDLPIMEGNVLYGNVGGDWPYGTSYLGVDGNDSVAPRFLSWGPSLPSPTWDLRLGPSSPLRDAGIGLDLDGTAADIGAFGGPAVHPDDLLDTDADGLYDSWELRFGLNPNVASAADDPDGDGLDNLAEADAGTWPDTSDTDGDGLDDGAEVLGGTDPVDASSP